ncbi:MAG: hypothetical protein KBS81_10070 [Spirochaetales bacterium]|nr:hypothetical protein [Candidatus Physcosoma equi]
MEKKEQKGINFLKESIGQKTFGFHKGNRTSVDTFGFCGKKISTGSFVQK